MKPTDLDDARDYANHRDHSRAQCKNGDRLILALVAELRAARELRRHIGYYLAMFNGTDELRRAVDAYDQLTEEPTP